MNDVERIAQTYSHTLHSDMIGELNRLRAALDEANTERDDLREVAAQCQRERNDMWHERDRAVAHVERVTALCDEAKANVYGQSWVPLNALRAALAGEGSEQLPAKPGDTNG